MAPRKQKIEKQPRSLLFSAVRNEGAYLLEWIAYHKAIGFTDIIIASNDCTDGTDDFLDTLEETGIITKHIRHSPGEGRPQGSAAAAFNATGLLSEYDWAIWLDADEFLVVNVGEGLLTDLLSKLDGADFLLVNWRVFAASEKTEGATRYIDERLTACKPANDGINRQIKTLFRIGPAIKQFGEVSIHRPLIHVDSIDPSRAFLGSGKPIDVSDKAHRSWLKGADTYDTHSVKHADIDYSLAQINHYFLRTAADFLLKKQRGRGWAEGSLSSENDRHTAAAFKKMKGGSQENRAILRMKDATQAGMDTLLKNEQVRNAYDVVMKNYSESIAALDSDEVAALVAKDTTISAPEMPPSLPAGDNLEEIVPGLALTLPPLEASAVREAYRKAQCVLEYGSGGSTALAVSLGVKRIVSVESDGQWAEGLRQTIAKAFPESAPEIIHEFIGRTKEWGFPINNRRAANFHRYALNVWSDPTLNPDVVLIDGRFRAACFYATLFHCRKPTTILFDDYVRRRYYHGIEEISKPVAYHGRMARFEVEPLPMPVPNIAAIIAAFSDTR